MNKFEVGSEHTVNLVDTNGKEIKVNGPIKHINMFGKCLMSFIIQDKETGYLYSILAGQPGIQPEAAIIED